MRNGLYSVHIHMLDGVKGRDSGIIVLRDGKLVGGGPYFWSVGSYSVGDGTWKGELCHQPAHAIFRPVPAPAVRRAGSLKRVFGNVCR